MEGSQAMDKKQMPGCFAQHGRLVPAPKEETQDGAATHVDNGISVTLLSDPHTSSAGQPSSNTNPRLCKLVPRLVLKVLIQSNSISQKCCEPLY